MNYRDGPLWRCVRAAIYGWNPYNLVYDLEDEEDTEFDSEVHAVCRALSPYLARRRKSTISAREISHLVSRIFVSSFADPDRFSPEKCAEVSEELLRLLQANGLARRG